ncbi:hypothetical protein SAMN05421774_11625 [Gemmobacter megaterium]|uniref:Uncharacterized protein n=1 Tax=Gemmobacter megaterium TaxID=1086013 RepID=A0A1N7QN35_9RHOB|nr:hypothetical protein [Gemmobacter megaterium]GGE27813.1 hypothetical protein GCM10011345_37340 [Gemmobacter megaterium]SIT24174.1 hypothetical protein SAMN05421774_11625 [Gemmobacter megaterium]
MAYVNELPTRPRTPTLRRVLAEMLRVAGLRPAEPAPAKRALAAPGPATEAIIDADMARMASFGSWSALRDELRASDQAARRTMA